MRVFILATCRKAELFPYTELVFKTLRTGFPNAQVLVFMNDLPREAHHRIEGLCADFGCESYSVKTIHHEWVEELVRGELAPFYLLDTDVIFYGNFEQFTFDGPMAGHRIPEWRDEFSGAITRSRLHTSLLYVDPVKTLAAIKAWENVTVDSAFTPKVNLFRPLVVPFRLGSFFYDTTSMLFHAIGGQNFEPKHKNTYFHFQFGTISDLVLPRLKDGATQQNAREEILKNPTLGIGRWREQDAYYANHPV